MFFPIFDKGGKGKKKGRERRRRRGVEHQLTTSRSSSRGSLLSGYQGISTVDSFSWLLHNKNGFQETDLHLSPVGGRERRLDDADGYNGNKRCYKQEDGHARLPSKIFVSRSIIKLGKKLLQVKISKGLLGSKVPNERPLSRNWRKYCAQLSVNINILTIFCMVSSDWTTRGSRDLLKNRTY